MERFKQTIATLVNDVAELKQFQTKIQGDTPQSKGVVHYCTSNQEFGEYALEELDTFRFSVSYQLSPGFNKQWNYMYRLYNPTPELSAYLKVQNKLFETPYIPVDPDNFEKYCMEKNGTPFALTDEIRKCLESKLWEFDRDFSVFLDRVPSRIEYATAEMHTYVINKGFYTDITIPFTHTYTICPHVSFYITPLSHMLDECKIHEITTKQVVFRIKYGNNRIVANNDSNPTIFSGLKLHYNINGIIKQDNNLLD